MGRTRTDTHSADCPGPVVFACSNACTMSFVLGRRDEVQLQAVRFYNWDGRSRCLATGGIKLAVMAFKQYLVIVRGNKGSYLSVDSVVNTTTALSSPADSSEPNDPGTVIIHDYLNHFIAGEFPVPGIISLVVEWDAIYALCEDPEASQRYSLVCISEKSAQAKLELLFSKKNFQLALDVAKSQNMSREDITQIVWRYADHLYKYVKSDKGNNETKRPSFAVPGQPYLPFGFSLQTSTFFANGC
ncbi:unnamed protein product [Echinostoma caproni]|uniref:LisH domain-containing protein n=1 Tax=Echinostoma caproni TaxID=27848 RepID=A0A183AYX5_9TREM|nr:unnamed protein product [Echinostoma caproni]